MTTIKVKNTYSTIEGDFSTVDLINLLSRPQRFYIKNWKTKKGEWKTRIITLFNKKYNTFPTGFLPQVFELYPGAELIDNRQAVSDFSIPQIDIKLRWYQEEALQNGINYERGVYHHVTASGKSYLAMKVIQMFQTPTLYIVPTLELLHDTYRKFIQFFPEEFIGIVGDNQWNPAVITIATNQTLWAKFEEDRVQELLKNVGLLCIDEGHHLNEAQYFKLSNTYYKVAMSCDARYRFAFTATPGNKESLSRFFLQGAIGNIIHHQGSKELIEKGLLSQPYINFIFNEITFPSWQRNEWRLAKNDGIMMNNKRNFMISELADHHRKKGDTVLIIVDRIEKHGGVLNDTIPYSKFLHGQTKKKERAEIRNEFREDKIPILISTLFTEGVDYPNINVVILALGGKTENGFYQKVGRSMRIAEGKNKCVIYDFIDEDNSILEKHSNLRIGYAESEEGYIVNKLSIEKWRKENV